MTDAAVLRRPVPSSWARIAPFAVFIALMAAEPWLETVVRPLFDPRWLYGIRSGITGLVLLALWRRYDELRGPTATASGAGAGAGASAWSLAMLGGVVVFGLWIALDFRPLVMGEPSPFDPRVNGSIHAGLALTRLAGATLVVPVMEELFWRSFLMRWLERPDFLRVDPRTVGLKPLLMTSAVFAVEHRLWFAGLLAGLIYGELYRRTGDLRAVIVAHAVTNGLLGVYVIGTGSWGFW